MNRWVKGDLEGDSVYSITYLGMVKVEGKNRSYKDFLKLVSRIELNAPGEDILLFMYLIRMNAGDEKEVDLLKKSFINNDIKQI
jgi:hypothetical protein